MNFYVAFVVALATSTFAEPPALSSSYGLPHLSSGYSYQPSIALISQGTDYIEQSVGHQTSEGLHLDSNLLNKISGILIQHENSGRQQQVYAAPSHSYGVPQSTYGPPSHWSGWTSSKVVGIDYDHLRQSHQVAQYLGLDRYASSHSGYSSQNSGWVAQSKPIAWQQPSVYIQPSSSYVSAPSFSLNAPSKSSGWARPAVKISSSRW